MKQTIIIVALLVASSSACMSTHVSRESRPVAVRSEAAALLPDKYSTDIQFPGAMVMIDVGNNLGVRSSSHVFGIPESRNAFGMNELGTAPFVIAVTVEGASASLDISNPVLQYEKDIVGSSLVPYFAEFTRTDCIRQIGGKFVPAPNPVTFSSYTETTIKGGQIEKDIFCVRIEFPVDPLHPDISFQVDFGTLTTANGSYPLIVQFEGKTEVSRATH